LNACSPFFASFCLLTDGCFLHFAGFGKASAKDFMCKLHVFFESIFEITRVKHGNKQSVGTLINEEALLLVK
jgi:hypothetical protein